MTYKPILNRDASGRISEVYTNDIDRQNAYDQSQQNYYDANKEFIINKWNERMTDPEFAANRAAYLKQYASDNPVKLSNYNKEWRQTKKMDLQDQRIADYNEIKDRIDSGNEQFNDLGTLNDLGKIINRQSLKFEKINRDAMNSFYENNPEYSGQFGAANPAALFGAVAPIAAGYAIQQSHGSLNPVSIPSAGAAELPPDVQAQQDAYNKMVMAEKFKNLGR